MKDDGDDASAEFASPPCYMHEIDPVYMGLVPAPDYQAGQDVLRWRKAGRGFSATGWPFRRKNDVHSNKKLLQGWSR